MPKLDEEAEVDVMRDEDALKEISDYFKALESDIVRTRLNSEPRIDGRDLDTVRPIAVETGILNQAHGSSLFTRAKPIYCCKATVDS